VNEGVCVVAEIAPARALERRTEMKKQAICAIALVCAMVLVGATPVWAGTSDRTIDASGWWASGLPALIADWWLGLVPSDDLEGERSEAKPAKGNGGPQLVGQDGETCEPGTTKLSCSIDPNG
jgi:hypothetical protein